jgi:hypothetical protein
VIKISEVGDVNSLAAGVNRVTLKNVLHDMGHHVAMPLRAALPE